MLYLLEVHPIVLVADQNAYSVFTAFFVDPIAEPLKLLVQSILTALKDA